MNSSGPIAGFLVHAGHVVEAGRPVIHLFGKRPDGRTFLARDRRFRPYFFVEARDAPALDPIAAGRPGITIAAAPERALHGGPALRVTVERADEERRLREALAGASVPTFESDLRYATRYLIDRGIRGAFRVKGVARPGDAAISVDHVLDDPAIAPGWSASGPPPTAQSMPALSVLSLDIETTADAGQLLSIALHGCGPDEVLLLQPAGAPLPPSVRRFPDEAGLLRAFVAAVRARNPDVLTGWNVVDFDLTVLRAAAARLGVALALGRDGSAPRISESRSFWAAGTAAVAGRVVLDGMQLLRGAFVQMEEYGLEYVARRVLGEGKTVAGDNRLDEIQALYRDDPARFAEYNLQDARLVVRIVEKLNLIDLAVERSLLTGMALDRVGASIASYDSLYLPVLRRRGFVAPAVDSRVAPAESTEGGLVLSPDPGLYRNVLVFDFKSLYPSVIRTFQIDPLGHVADETIEGDFIVAPNGARFRREPGILPGILDELFPRREAARRAGDSIKSHAIKILMKSVYGVLGSPACRFHDAALANAITGFGREILLWSKARLERAGHRVLYGDTDSLFVLAGTDDEAEADRARARLLDLLNRELGEHLRATYRVESRLELEFDTLYLRLHLPRMRHGEGGARKRYAGLAIEDGERRVVFTGMEAQRRDWTELAKEVQRGLYERLFNDRPVDVYLRDTMRRLREGALDELLVYRKALRKPLASYTESTPPHVAAARKQRNQSGRLVTYLMTTAGPEPAGERRHPIDRAHYLEKQIRPIAEPVLELLGLDFDAIAGKAVQLSLFE